MKKIRTVWRKTKNMFFLLSGLPIQAMASTSDTESWMSIYDTIFIDPLHLFIGITILVFSRMMIAFIELNETYELLMKSTVNLSCSFCIISGIGLALKIFGEN